MIRLAVPSDTADIATLHVKTWQVAYRGHMPDDYLDALEPSNRVGMWSKAIVDPATLVLVSVAQSSLVGFCSFLPSRDTDATPEVGEIATLYVDARLWRVGIGTALVDTVVESALRRNFTELTLWVVAANVSACSFYEARRFEADGHTKTDEWPGFSIHQV